MLSLVTPNQEDPVMQERQIVLNKVIAAGLNSLAQYAGARTEAEERKLLDTFVIQSFENILPCWPYLDDRIKFHIFKIHAEDFEKYMIEKRSQVNV